MCVYEQSKRPDKINVWICAPAIDSVSVFFGVCHFPSRYKNYRFRFYFSDGLFRSGNFLPLPVLFLGVLFSEYVINYRLPVLFLRID